MSGGAVSDQVAKQCRDATLAALVKNVPYISFLGIEFDRHGDELTGILRFDDKLIGNPFLPAIHGGVTSAFLEVTSVIALSMAQLWDDFDANEQRLLCLPKTIDFTVDYLRSGRPRDSYARATIARAGRRYASVQVKAWQDNQDKPFAQASGHFLMPTPRETSDG